MIKLLKDQLLQTSSILFPTNEKQVSYRYHSNYTSLTLSFNTVNVYLHSHWVFLVFIVLLSSIILKFILNQSRCSLEPKNYLRVLHPLKPHRGLRTPLNPPSSFDASYAHFTTDYIHSWDHVWYLHIGHTGLKEMKNA